MGILRITVDDTARTDARSARVHVSLKGSAAVFGNAATKQSAEVRSLVSALSAAGVEPDAIEVTGVRLESRGGVLARSQAEYLLAIAATPDELPAVLGILGDQPNLTLSQLEWVFDSFEASIGATVAAMAKARRKADAVAAAAGVRITGIGHIGDSWSMPGPVAFAADEIMATRALKASGPVDLGVDLNATQELFVHLTVDFEVAS